MQENCEKDDIVDTITVSIRDDNVRSLSGSQLFGKGAVNVILYVYVRLSQRDDSLMMMTKMTKQNGLIMQWEKELQSF